ncbi:MAG: chemotaxis protein CheW [Pseudomonadota bacterium]
MLKKDTNESTDLTGFSTFFVGDSLFGIDVLTIQEINRNFEVTQVPQSPDYVYGILNLRGKIVTIIDLGKKLGLGPVENNTISRNIIINSQGELLGLMVTDLGDILHADCKMLEPAPSNFNRVKGSCFKGVLKTENQLIGILDMNELLQD